MLGCMQEGECSRELLPQGTVTSTMRKAAHNPVRCWRWLFGNKTPTSLQEGVASLQPGSSIDDFWAKCKSDPRYAFPFFLALSQSTSTLNPPPSTLNPPPSTLHP